MRPPTRLMALAAVFAALLAFALPASAKPGELDQTYGQNGWAWAPFRACDCGGNASMRVQPDGKIVALGATGIARFLPSGALDKTFGTNGVVPLQLGNAVPDGLAIDHLGRIIVVAHVKRLKVMSLHRWHYDGSPDGSFAPDIRSHAPAVTPVGVAEQVLRGRARYIVAGTGASGEFTALAFRGNGSADPTFGISGRAAISGHLSNIWPEVPVARSLAIEPGTGRVVIAGQLGRGELSAGGSPMVGRFTANGLPDVLFGIGGMAYPDVSYYTEGSGLGLAVAEGGSIYLTAYGNYRWDRWNIVVWRLTPSGFSDDRFASYGWADYSSLVRRDAAYPPEQQRVLGDFASAVALQSDGKILVSATRFVNGYSGGQYTHFYRTQLLRLLPSGHPDLSFGASGWANGLAGDGRALLVRSGQVFVGGDVSDAPPIDTFFSDTPTRQGTRLGFRISRFSQ